MIKSCVINGELSHALALARHKDAIVLCDANMPIPEGCRVIDVSLVRGIPTLLQTLKAVLNDLVAERSGGCWRSCPAGPSASRSSRR